LVDEQECTLTGHSDWVSSVAYSREHIVSGSGDRTVKVWDAQCPTEEQRRAEGERLRAAEASSIRQRAEEEAVCTLTGHSNEVWSVSYSPDGKHIASGSQDKTVKIWDAQSGEEVRVVV